MKELYRIYNLSEDQWFTGTWRRPRIGYHTLRTAKTEATINLGKGYEIWKYPCDVRDVKAFLDNGGDITTLFPSKVFEKL